MNSRSGRPSMLEAVTLGLVATGAVSIAIAALTGAIRAGFEIFGSPVPVALPVHDAEMGSLTDAAGVASASYTQSLVSFETLDAGIRWLLLGEQALPALATIIVCMSLWWLGLSLIRQRAFRKSMAPVLGTAAIALVVAGMIGPLLGAFARAEAVQQLPASDGEFYAFLYELDPSPIGWGIALALVVSAFEVGRRLQRETEGLV
ncbi:hypothetical protein L2X99_17525 [Microbacterium sp. KUDC0406]|uniref:hypothetical protein n=1 Tax=Microbacterium sp. KUDC0406 TaxID=2909588 RepID=UPI001F458EBF|nr:hypothetical protein [Microbacterium sp. KUDC0406]UJP10122.1 hypothetical protein L2X99_17525 [Microbacterium sp. KUDC0406]